METINVNYTGFKQTESFFVYEWTVGKIKEVNILILWGWNRSRTMAAHCYRRSNPVNPESSYAFVELNHRPVTFSKCPLNSINEHKKFSAKMSSLPQNISFITNFYGEAKLKRK